MRASLLPRLGAVIAAAFIISAPPAAFAAGSHFNTARSTQAGIEPTHPFEADIPGASEAWCDTLPFPYCDEPAPGVGPIPYADPMPRHPIFGE